MGGCLFSVLRAAGSHPEMLHAEGRDFRPGGVQ